MNAIRDGTKIRIHDGFMIRESLKSIHGCFYDPDDRAWLVPMTPENVATLALLGIELSEDLRQEIKTEIETDEVPIVSMPIRAKPYKHQVNAYNFALRTFGIGGTL